MSSTTQTEDFAAVRTLPGSPEDVSALFTTTDGISRWWGPTDGDASVGGTFVTHFGHHGTNAMRVVEAGPEGVVWESVIADGPAPTAHAHEWLATMVEIDLRSVDGGTELRFRHSGLTPQLECWDECLAGWTHFLGSIEACVRTGTGTPFGS